MLADDLTNRAQFRRDAKIRPQLPNDGSVARNDREERRLAAADDHVIRRKALVALVEPAVRTNVGRRIDVHPIKSAAAGPTPSIDTWRRCDSLASILVEMEFVDVIARDPLPDDLPFPCDFDNPVV